MLRRTGIFLILLFSVACNSQTLPSSIPPNIIIMRNFPPNSSGYELYACNSLPLQIAMIDGMAHDIYIWDRDKWIEDKTKSCTTKYSTEKSLTPSQTESVKIDNKNISITEMVEAPSGYDRVLPFLSISGIGNTFYLHAVQNLSGALDDGSCRSINEDSELKECMKNEKLINQSFVDSVSFSIFKLGDVNYLRFWAVQYKQRESQTILVSLPHILELSREQLFCIDNVLILLSKYESSNIIDKNNLNKCRRLN